MVKEKFKVGDVIEIIDVPEEDGSALFSKRIKKGTVGVITEMDEYQIKMLFMDAYAQSLELDKFKPEKFIKKSTKKLFEPTGLFKPEFTFMEESLGYLAYVKLYEEFFGGLGIQEVKYQENFRELDDMMYEKLTLVIMPTGNELQQKTMKYIPEKFKKEKGYNDTIKNFMVINKDRVPEDIKPIMFDKEMVGFEWTNRNAMVLLFNPFDHKHGLWKNQSKTPKLLLDELFKAMKAAKIKKMKKVDIEIVLQEKLIAKFTKSWKERRIQLGDEILSVNKQGTDDMSRAIGNFHREKVLKEEARSVEEGLKKVGTIVRTEMKKIEELPFVKSVALTTDGIKIKLSKVILKYKDTEYDLGEFLINLGWTRVTLKNVKPDKFGGLHHPHISGDSICYGEGSGKVAKLIKDMKYRDLIYYMYSFLRSYNPDDHYNHIDSFKAGIVKKK